MDRATDVVVIGGGLAGLTAAAYLGRTGLSATVLEKAEAPGGRAITQKKAGFSMNLGAHALYAGGAGKPIVDELGVAYRGHLPSSSGLFGYDAGALHTLPAGFFSLVTTGLLPLSAKLELGRLLGSFGSIDASKLAGITAAAWLAQAIKAPEVRALIAALFRVSTYTADMERLSAGTAVRQFQLALKHNVLYLDGGWQTLVDGLAKAATDAGATILTDAKGAAIDVEGGAVTGVRLADGRRIAARAAVIASSPGVAAALVPGDSGLARAADRAVPVKAACLDVALSRLPNPRAVFALGIDLPLYVSVHSSVADLAPEGGAMIHAMEYLATGKEGDEAAIEALLDKLQPGFRDLVVARRFLPSLTVSHAIVTAEDGGISGRPSVAVPSIAGLFLAGDWVGPEGALADASLSSAKRAAELASQLLSHRRAA